MIWFSVQLFALMDPSCHILIIICHIINPGLTDDDDVMRQTRSLYAKLALSKTYCMPIYGCQLWSQLFQYSNRKQQVAYNDSFRQCCVNQDGVVRQGCLYTIGPNVPSFDAVFVNWCILICALFAKVIICWSKLSYPVTFLSVISFSKVV